MTAYVLIYLQNGGPRLRLYDGVDLELMPDFISLFRTFVSVRSYSGPLAVSSKKSAFGQRNIGIKHGFSCINIRQVPWEMLKTEAGGRGFQHLSRDLANVNALKKHVRSLLLHKNWKHLLNFALFPALFCFVFSPMPHERNFYGLCSL